MGDLDKSLTYDILNREVKGGDLVLLFNTVDYVSTLDTFHLGILIGKHRYAVYNKKGEIKECLCNQVYLLDDSVEEIKNHKVKLLNSYNDFRNKQIKEEVEKQTFKSSSHVHEVGEVFKDKFDRLYLYLGPHEVTVTYPFKNKKLNDTVVYTSSGLTYIRLPDNYFEIMGDDEEEICIEALLMSWNIRSHYEFSDFIFGLKRFSNRFVGRYNDNMYKVIDCDKEINVDRKIVYGNGYRTDIHINMKPIKVK